MQRRTDGIQPSGFKQSPSARVGRVRLAVSNLEQSVAFYRDVIGLKVLPSDAPQGPLAKLGTHDAPETLLELQELPGVRPLGDGQRLGLYHFALLLPSRDALSSFLQHLQRSGTRFGSSDHVCSEALYLRDPDGLGVEVYADRPSTEWVYKDGEIVTGIYPLNLGELVEVTTAEWTGAPKGTTVGHVHLNVGELDRAKQFYHSGLGLDIVLRSIPTALFLSVPGYHHRVGLNLWAAGSPPASERDARLLYWELVLPTEVDTRDTAESLTQNGFSPRAEKDENTFLDPWGIAVFLPRNKAS